MSETSPSRASKLLKVLDLKQIEENLYQGQNETENGSRLFGGQVLAQGVCCCVSHGGQGALALASRLFFAAGTRRFARTVRGRTCARWPILYDASEW
jgi:hypothetical protein